MTDEMFDSIDPSQIPAGQDAAGYVDGRWRTFTALHAPHILSVAVFASDDADALDDEPGDATNAQAPGWVRRELSLGHWRPCVYTSASNVGALLAALAAAGINRAQIRLWTAHYTYQSHLCSSACGLPAGVTADATQWTDRSGGRNLDESTITADFFATPTTQENDMLLVYTPTEGIWFLSGGLYIYLDDPNEVTSAQQAGIKSWTVSDKTHQSLLAAPSHAAASVGTLNITGSIAGSATPA